jgi:hypothetical protein
MDNAGAQVFVSMLGDARLSPPAPEETETWNRAALPRAARPPSPPGTNPPPMTGSQGSQALPMSSFRIVGSSSATATATQGVSGKVILPDHSRVPALPRFKINSFCASGSVRLSVRMLNR